MIRRFNLIIGLGCIVLLLQGCPPPSTRIIYNNTGTDLILQLKNRKVEWKAGTTIKFGNENNAIARSELVFERDPNKFIYATLKILHGERTLKYEYNYKGRVLPSEYVDRSTGQVTTFWQLESNDSLYITLPKSYFPVKMPISQPTGYPIKPVIVFS